MFIGKWIQNGMEFPNALVVIRHAVSRKDGIVSVFDVYESEAHRAAGVAITGVAGVNGPVVPVVENMNAARNAYFALGIEYPELIPDEDAGAVPQEIINAFTPPEPSDESIEELSWSQKVLNFFKWS